MTNTINNVPRELLEVIEQTWRINYRGAPVTTDLAADAIEKGLGQLRAILSAPSPAGVDDDYVPEGLAQAIMQSEEVDAVSLAAKSLKAAVVDGLPEFLTPELKSIGEAAVAKAVADQCYSVPVLQTVYAEAVLLSVVDDAQAIIDGLLGELEAAGEILAQQGRRNTELRKMRDQQAQRIGELEGLLLRVQVSLSLDDTEWGYSGAEKYKLLADIRAALSAGKEGSDGIP